MLNELPKHLVQENPNAQALGILDVQALHQDSGESMAR